MAYFLAMWNLHCILAFYIPFHFSIYSVLRIGLALGFTCTSTFQVETAQKSTRPLQPVHEIHRTTSYYILFTWFGNN